MHYHGTPITPRSALQSLAGRNFCVSFAAPADIAECHRIGQSVMLDNGAFSVWRRGLTVDWEAWVKWAQPWLDYKTTWAVLPDVIGGSEDENDHLAATYAWMVAPGAVAPVWHLHESFRRLERLCAAYGRVCFGSSGAFATVGSVAWHRRVSGAFDRIADPSGAVPWIHMLRGMSLAGTQYPFASVDSTDVAQNHNRPQNTALSMADRWDGLNNPCRWKPVPQLELEVAS
jgi:hypothetical protein